MLAKHLLPLAALQLATPTAASVTPNRTMTYWAGASDPMVHGRPSCYNPPCPNWTKGSADWETRFQKLEKHRANFTGLIPTMHAVVSGGKLGLNGDGSYKNWLPQLPRLKKMGLEITAFLGNAARPQQAALEAAIKRGPAFYDDCIQMALKNGYDGYSVDNELMCKSMDSSCYAKLASHGFPQRYMAFLNGFADALHKHGMILSVFIDGCCGYTNPYEKTRGCLGAEAKYDYQAVQCLDFTNSSVDRVLSHATYGGSWHNATPGAGMWQLQTMAAVGAKVIGTPKFSVGIKGGFEPPLLPKNQTPPALNCTPATGKLLPEACFGRFDAAGQRAISGLHKLGVMHLAKFMDEPRTQAEWDAWGWHLHGPAMERPLKSDDYELDWQGRASMALWEPDVRVVS